MLPADSVPLAAVLSCSFNFGNYKQEIIMPKITKKHMSSDKKESKAIYKSAEKIEKNAEKMMSRDKKVKKSK